MFDDVLAQRVEPHLRQSGPGLLLAVQQDGKPIQRRAFGFAHLELGVPLDVDMLFPIASISKQLTSMCALLLIDEGLLELEAPIGKYLPELPLESQRPTLLQLMNHMSGLHCFVDTTALDPLRSPRPEDVGLRTLIALQTRNAQPGARQVYCPSGHYLLSLAFERVTETSFEEVMTNRLFTRLGMHATRNIRFPTSIVPGSPSHYEAGLGADWINVTADRFPFLGEGGIYSSVDDLLAWAKALRTEDPRIPRAAWRNLKRIPELPNGQLSHYGLGLQVQTWRGVEVLGHGGGCPGIATHLLTCPEHGVDVVVLANCPVPALQVALDVLAATLDETTLEPLPIEVATSLFPALSGRLYVAPQLVAEVSDRNGKLALSLCGNPPAVVSSDPSGAADFVLSGVVSSTTFKSVGQRLHVRMNGEDHVCARAVRSEESGDEPDDFLGAFENVDLRSRFFFRRTKDKFSFEYLGHYGWASGEILVLTSDLLRLIEPSSPLWGIHLRLWRTKGRVEGFSYETSRTLGLPFIRMD